MIKACAIIISFLLFVSFSLAESNELSTDKEILFRGIAWEQDINTVNPQLKTASIKMSDGYETDLLSWERFAPYHSSGEIHSKYDVGLYSIGEALSEDVTVGGHKFSMVLAYYYYDLQDGTVVHDFNSSHLYMVNYILNFNDVDGSFNDLKGKLMQLYGEGKEESDGRTYGIQSHVWTGANNTAVRLTIDKGTASGPSLYLVYYKTDSTEHIKLLDAAEKEEQYKKDQDNWDSNVDGL